MDADLRDALAREARRVEEDCSYSAKGHYEAARIWGRWNLGLGVPAAVIGAVAGASAFRNLPQLAGALALFAGAMTAVLTFLKPSDKASSHHRTGSLYNSLRNRARFFREVDLVEGGNPTRVAKRLRQIANERNELNEVSPEIPRPAFERARAGIESGEAVYEVDRGSPEQARLRNPN